MVSFSSNIRAHLHFCQPSVNMQPNTYAPYQGTNPATMPVRYMVPNSYRQSSPPFTNMAFDRYNNIATGVHPPVHMMAPVRNPYPPPVATPRMPVQTTPRPPQPGEQLQPPQPYYYNPYGASPVTSVAESKTPAPKKGAKEYKETAFTIKPDGAEGDAIRGLVSNDDINKLLTHKGTKVKVAKIYRITKSKPDPIMRDSSDEDIPLPTPAPATTPAVQARNTPAQPRNTPAQAPASQEKRSDSRSSCSSCCSSCRSSSSCSSCRSYRRSHSYDDCPECIAERREHRRRRRRDRR